MKDIFVLYAFLALMILNILATFLYIAGLDGVRAGFRRAFRTEKRQ
jgi:hypothetical protein